MIRDEVSEYSLQEKDGGDFVAEVFCGLMLGRKFSDEIMKLYKEIGGPMPNFEALQETDGNQNLNDIISITGEILPADNIPSGVDASSPDVNLLDVNSPKAGRQATKLFQHKETET
jgi:hypothetical protein